MSKVGQLVFLWLIYVVAFTVGLWLGGANEVVVFVGGPVAALIAVLVMRRRLVFGTLDGLDLHQRRRIGRAMRNGEAVDSPELARPLVNHASAVVRSQSSAKFARVCSVIVLVCGVVSIGLSLAIEGTPGWSGLLLLGGGAALLLCLQYMQRVRDLAARSRQATESRWGQGHDPTGSDST